MARLRLLAVILFSVVAAAVPAQMAADAPVAVPATPTSICSPAWGSLLPGVCVG